MRSGQYSYAVLKPVKLKVFREQAGMSRQALAARSNVSAPTISRTEAGRYVPYDAELERLADALGVENPADLLGAIDD